MQVGGGGYIDVSVMPTNEGNKEWI
jgi:hypothetical protein